MNDLHDLLERVSEPRRDWLADSAALLHEGRRRVRRRRLTRGAIASAAVLAVGAVGASPLVGFHSHKATPSATSYADLNLTPLSNDEVARRCLPVMKLDPGDLPTDFVVPDSITHPNPGLKPDRKEYQTPKPWHVGTQVLVMPRTHQEWLHYGSPAGCTIPEAGRAPQAFTRVSTVAQLRGDCADNLGIDLDGWQQLTAVTDGTASDALFRSGNGYLVHCTVERSDGVQGSSAVIPEHAWGNGTYMLARCMRMSVDNGSIECVGDGRVDDHTADQVDVTLPSGRVVRTDAVDGYWSVTVRDDASGTWEATPPGATFKATPVR